MILEMYTVLDRAVKAYLQPFYVRSRGEALRSFSDTVNQKDHQFNKHAADYSLWFLGVFDDGDASIKTQEPVRVITAMECLVDDEVFPQSKRVE